MQLKNVIDLFLFLIADGNIVITTCVLCMSLTWKVVGTSSLKFGIFLPHTLHAPVYPIRTIHTLVHTLVHPACVAFQLERKYGRLHILECTRGQRTMSYKPDNIVIFP